MKESVRKAAKGLWTSFPMILATILLVSLISVIVPKSFYVNIFGENLFWNSFIGAIVGSISAGNPITSYVFGGEMLNQGVSLVAVTAFLVSWVTVGLIQLPAESAILGKKFAITRNVIAFLFSIVIAILTIFFVGWIG